MIWRVSTGATRAARRGGRTILGWPTSTYEHALVLARRWHAGQTRKGVETPYLSHLLAVSALVMEAGGDEVQAIAGLLHDALEDADSMEEYRARREQIGTDFVPEVLEIVEACTDGTPDEKRAMDWQDRKERYLESLAEKGRRSLLVTAADKTHNARAILSDLVHGGPEVFDRFTGSPEQTLWYYRSLAAIVDDRRRSTRSSADASQAGLARTHP